MTMVETNAVAERRSNPIAEVRASLDAMSQQFQFALPAHVPVERFMRVVMTAVQGSPYLLKAERRSLFSAAMKAAQDGLLPDGREGALVPYGNEVTWIPMIAGLRKKVRNSGEIATWDVHAVYANDKFEFELGDNPFIKHAPTLKDRGALIAVYSVATLKSGEKSRDVMGVDEVKRIRDRSQAYKLFKAGKIKSTPWDTDFDEMSKKTVARRHSKVLPMSTDLDDLIRRDDALYDFDSAREHGKQGASASGLAGRLDALGGGQAAPAIEHNPETGEIADEPQETGSGASTASEAAASEGERPHVDAAAADRSRVSDDPFEGHSMAWRLGWEAADQGVPRDRPPSDLNPEEAEEWQAGHDSWWEAKGGVKTKKRERA
jgi:recombination protein RecT